VRLILALALLFSALTCPAAAAQHDEARPQLSDLARNASHVVIGKVAKTEARWVKRKIVTSATIEVVESLKGTVARDKRLTVTVLGGRVGVLEQDVSHEATLETGEIALLFLSDRAGTGNELRIVGPGGKQTLLGRGMAQSRLQSNRRLAAYLKHVREVVRDAK
jgi:hypothetical protein